MDVTSLFFRALDNRGNIYSPYSFNGDWTEEEMNRVKSVINSYVPDKVDAMFNNWIFSKYGSDVYSGVRATWERGSLGGTLDELISGIVSYYSK